MKHRVYLLATMLFAVLALTACGEKEVPDPGPEIGGDWHVWNGYITLDWHAPDTTQTIYIETFPDSGAIRVLAEGESYSPICECDLPQEKFGDISLVQNSLNCEDQNNDGYDDLVLHDMIDGKEKTFVMLWNPEKMIFEVQ